MTGHDSVGGRLLGAPDQPGHRLELRVEVLTTLAVVVANLTGGVAVAFIAAYLHGGIDRFTEAGVRTLNLVLVPAYSVVAVVVGVVWGVVLARRRLAWVRDERVPDPDEVRTTLRLPLVLTRLQAGAWGLALLLFTLLNGLAELELGLEVAMHVGIGGAVVCAIAYLTTELLHRPVAARALAHHVPDELQVPGIRARQLLAWGLGVLPVVGLLTLGVSALARDDLDRTQIAVAIVVLVSVTLVAGGLLVLLTAHATAGPIQDLRAAVARLDDGDLDVELEVYDGTEVGLLQAGFNRAVAGLRDRERVRDLFGRHVGEEVASSALEGDVGLGGEEVEVAVLFVDVIGATQLASRLPPQEVVDVLNRFFEVVIDVVDEHHGLVNKFAGDAVLAVFGAPSPIPDAAGAALVAARQMADRLAGEVDAFEAGIGVAAGRAVAGNVGHARRFEYTVIGDAVNEASRLCDLAKQEPQRVLASMRAVEQAPNGERGRWVEQRSEVLRGRDEPTRIATPTG